MNRIRHFRHISNHCAFALAGCTAAANVYAQQVQDTASASAPTPVLASESSTLERITITTTVRKKLERVQDIPATISVLSGGELSAAGVTDIRGIEYKVPGLTLGDAAFEGAAIGMRGAASIATQTGNESAVAVHLDGIYVPQSGAALGRLFDVARVEALFGPQGTLYGRNAVAGAIDIVSNAPTKSFGGDAQISYGSFNTVSGEATLNIPLDESNGLRFAIAGANGDGFIKNILDSRSFGNADFRAFRARYKGVMADKVTIDLIYQFVHDNSTSPLQPARFDDVLNGTKGVTWRHTAVDQPVDAHRKDQNIALKVDFDLNGLTLRSVTGYNTYDFRKLTDDELSIGVVRAGAGKYGQGSEAGSQELTLISYGDLLDWRIGTYFSRTRVKETRFADNTASSFPGLIDAPDNPAPLTSYDDYKMFQLGKAKAVFGSIDWHVNNSITTTLGARFNSETKSMSQSETAGFHPLIFPAPECNQVQGYENPCHASDSKGFKWNGSAGDLTIKWQASPQTQTYGRIARGFRSGAIAGVTGLDNYLDQLGGGTAKIGLLKLDPEKLDSYEIGAKNTLLDRTLLFNLAAYFNKYQDQLVYTLDPITFQYVAANVGESQSRGIDVNLAWIPTSSWRMDASLGYLDATIKLVGPTVAGDVKVGNKAIFAPRLSYSLGATYKTGVFGGQFLLGGDVSHKDKMYQDLENHIEFPSLTLLNLNAGWTSPKNAWRLFFSVSNFTNRKYLTNTNNPNYMGPGPLSSLVGEPRSFKLGAGFSF